MSQRQSETSAFTFHGKEGEDFLALTFFGTDAKGFYVDIGAFDGRHGSATFLFEGLGWSGLCVGAHPGYASMLGTNRPGAVCLHGAVVAELDKGSSEVTVHADDLGLLTGINRPDSGDLARQYGAFGRVPAAVPGLRVPAFTLDGLLEQHAGGRRSIDLMHLDTHGTEAAVLASMEPGEREIRMLIVRAESDAEREALAAVLERHGLVRARQLDRHMLFVNDMAAAMALDFRRLDCVIADSVHPRAPRTTPKHQRGRTLTDPRFRMSDNVLCQQTQQPLSAILDFPPPEPDRATLDAIPLVHGINLFSPDGRTVDATQQAVCASMAASARADDGAVDLVAVQSAEDPDLTPEGFTRARDLDRDARGLAAFARPRPLPLLFDVLDRLAEHTPADGMMIFTNADICLKPQFYAAVRELVAQGFDALVINRRTISPDHAFARGSVLALAETGVPHPGYDCFVFPRAHYVHYVRNQALIGIPGVARGLVFNMVARAERMLVLRNVALTHHFGDDRTWRAPDLADYAAFNRQENQVVRVSLSQDPVRGRRIADFIARKG